MPMSEPNDNPGAEQYENIGNYYDSWQGVEADLRRLDGDSSDSIFIASTGRNNMSISGGNENRYHVEEEIGGQIFICSSGEDAGSIKDVAACWDLVPLPSAYVVDLETAIVAAKEFYETGRLSPRLKWDKS